MKATSIVLADDQLLVRAGIRALLETLPGCRIDAECADGISALAEIERLRPDIAVLDIAMPGLTGIELSAELRRREHQLGILILSGIETPETIDQAFAVGADGYLHKDFLLGELKEAVTAVLAGQRYLSPKLQQILETHGQRENGNSGDPCLTRRQTEILRLVASGRTTKEIARVLGISPKTVEFHRARLMERLGVHEVTALTRFAIQCGLIS
ncbi:MAG: response regulator transcription factor [Dechloromonas sp.]|nr:MAG: response regulator transcription factor [Dechloromonas sp.]